MKKVYYYVNTLPTLLHSALPSSLEYDDHKMKVDVYSYVLFVLSHQILKALADETPATVIPLVEQSSTPDNHDGLPGSRSSSETGKPWENGGGTTEQPQTPGKSEISIAGNDNNIDSDEDDNDDNSQKDAVINLVESLEEINARVKEKADALGRYVRDTNGGAGAVHRLLSESTQLATEVERIFKLFVKREVTLTHDMEELKKALFEAVNSLKKSLENENKELVDATIEVDATAIEPNSLAERKKRNASGARNSSPYKACVSIEPTRDNGEFQSMLRGLNLQPPHLPPPTNVNPSIHEYIPPLQPDPRQQSNPQNRLQNLAPPNQESNSRTYMQTGEDSDYEENRYPGFGPLPMYPLVQPTRPTPRFPMPMRPPPPQYLPISSSPQNQPPFQEAPQQPQNQPQFQGAHQQPQYQPPFQEAPQQPQNQPQFQGAHQQPQNQLQFQGAQQQVQYQSSFQGSPQQPQNQPQFRGTPQQPQAQYQPPSQFRGVPQQEQNRPMIPPQPSQNWPPVPNQGSPQHLQNRPLNPSQPHPSNNEDEVDLKEVYWLRLDPRREQKKLRRKVDDLLRSKQNAGKDVLVIPVSHDFQNVEQVKEGFLRAMRLKPNVMRSRRDIFRQIRSLNIIAL